MPPAIFDFKAIKAALNRLTGKAPSGEAFTDGGERKYVAPPITIGGWVAAAGLAQEQREKRAADILNTAFNTPLDPAQPDGKQWPFNPSDYPPERYRQYEKAFGDGSLYAVTDADSGICVWPGALRKLQDSAMYASHPPGSTFWNNNPGPETDLTEQALENALAQIRQMRRPLANCMCNECRPMRMAHDLGSTQFGPESMNDCCGNPALHAIAYQGREIVIGFDMTGSEPRPAMSGLSFRAAGDGYGPWHLCDLHRPLPHDYEACDLGVEGLVIFERKMWPDGGSTFYRGDALFSIKRDEEIGITIHMLR